MPQVKLIGGPLDGGTYEYKTGVLRAGVQIGVPTFSSPMAMEWYLISDDLETANYLGKHAGLPKGRPEKPS
jgi:hypothetical protein